MNAQTTSQQPDRVGGNGSSRGPGDGGLHAQIDRHRENLDQTLSELESRLSPGELLDSSLHYVKDGPGEFLRNLGGAAKVNPMPMALIGVGLGWLMLGHRDDSGSVASKLSGAARSAKDKARGAASRMRSGGDEQEDFEHDVDTAGISGEPELGDVYAFCLREEYPFEDSEIECIIFEDLGPGALSSYRTGLHRRRGMETTGMGTAARPGEPHLDDDARGRIESTRARMAEGSTRVKDRISQARSAAWRRANRASEKLSRRAHEAGQRGSELVDRYPLSLVALGLAAGTALGATLPGTRREDELMGEASDDVKAKARATLREKGERAKQAARDAGQAAMDEARAQGLDPERLKEEGRRLGEDARHAADTAREDFESHRGDSTRDLPRKAREKAERIAGAARDAAMKNRGQDA
jgi:hypothetical protein